MNETKKKVGLSGLELRVGVAIVLCLLLCRLVEELGFSLQALAACTGAVMCTQEGGKASFAAGKNRILGVVCGGVTGVVVVLLDSWIGLELVFYLLVGLGIVANFLLCRWVKLPLIQARVSCMTVLLVVLVLGGNARISYAIGRFLGTLLGALVAWLLSFVWAKIFVKKEEA